MRHLVLIGVLFCNFCFATDMLGLCLYYAKGESDKINRCLQGNYPAHVQMPQPQPEHSEPTSTWLNVQPQPNPCTAPPVIAQFDPFAIAIAHTIHSNCQ